MMCLIINRIIMRKAWQERLPSCYSYNPSAVFLTVEGEIRESKCLQAQKNSMRDGSAPAAEDGTAATASSFGSHSRGTSLRRNLWVHQDKEIFVSEIEVYAYFEFGTIFSMKSLTMRSVGRGRAESATPSRGGGGMLDRAGSSIGE